MNKVQRAELLPLGDYEQIRPHFRKRVIELKKARRLKIGPHMSLVFETHDTVLLQVQEMLRTERITDEAAIAHELTTYNELIPEGDQLKATLFIEYDDPAERAVMLRRFASLRHAVHLRLGRHLATAAFSTHFGEEMDRLPAVNYLTFDLPDHGWEALLDPGLEVALEVSHPDYSFSAPLPRRTREQLATDLG